MIAHTVSVESKGVNVVGRRMRSSLVVKAIPASVSKVESEGRQMKQC